MSTLHLHLLEEVDGTCVKLQAKTMNFVSALVWQLTFATRPAKDIQSHRTCISERSDTHSVPSLNSCDELGRSETVLALISFSFPSRSKPYLTAFDQAHTRLQRVSNSRRSCITQLRLANGSTDFRILDVIQSAVSERGDAVRRIHM